MNVFHNLCIENCLALINIKLVQVGKEGRMKKQKTVYNITPVTEREISDVV